MIPSKYPVSEKAEARIVAAEVVANIKENMT